MHLKLNNMNICFELMKSLKLSDSSIRVDPFVPTPQNQSLIFSHYFPMPLHKKMKFSVKDISSKCEEIRSFLRIWSHLLEINGKPFVQCALKNFTKVSRGIQYILRSIANILKGIWTQSSTSKNTL